MKLWYERPASSFEEALPLGNGRLGGMLYGSQARERLQLNEDSVWYGGPHANADNPDAYAFLPEIRRLLDEGKQQEAEHLARMTLMSSPRYMHPYQPLGDLFIWMLGHDATASRYRRELDLENAVARTNYTLGSVDYQREAFSSAADGVVVMRLTAGAPHELTFSVNLMRRPFDGGSIVAGEDTILMRGECGADGVRFAVAVKAVAEGGAVRTVGDSISVEKSDAVTLIVAVNTTYRCENPEEESIRQAQETASLSYQSLYERHIADYAERFRRVSLAIHSGTKQALALEHLPTDARLKRVKEGQEDLGLVPLYFQYGRYLLLSCSRPDSLAANLQGIWNDSFTPPWESKYTINVNTQMNYWPAETCNLAECHEPLFDLIERMVPNGRKTAQSVYGCSGFVAHHNTNIWGETHVEGTLVSSSIWPMGAAWLALHLWEHYRFGGDISFLAQRAYPILREASIFFVDYTTEDASGRLLTGPSLSPENRFIRPNGQTGTLCMAPSMDSQIIFALWTACIEASRELSADMDFRVSLETALRQLPKPAAGKHGELMEWLDDWEEQEPGHRHISHLFALHPGEQIHVRRTPELAAAARLTLERRLANGGGHTGWSRAWIMNFWARLEDGDEAHRHLLLLLAQSTYPNLLDAHPPFQIDGNLGATAGIAEMLLQSHVNELTLLPALPRAWRSGIVTGLRARGMLEVDLEWVDWKLSLARLKASRDGICRVRYAAGLEVYCGGTTVSFERLDDLITFQIRGGGTYELRPVPIREPSLG